MILDIFAVVPLAGTWIEIEEVQEFWKAALVVPLAGTWIEIVRPDPKHQRNTVVPLAGTWIEISSLRLAPAIH